MNKFSWIFLLLSLSSLYAFCQDGEYFVPGGGGKPSRCEICPVGYLCPYYELIPCPAGYMCPFPGAYTIEYMYPCPAGSYNPDEASATCYACPNGHYSDEDASTECKKCAPGTYTNDSVAHKLKCLPCPAAYYAPDEGTIDCTKCPGQYSSRPGSSSISQCSITCPTGMYIGETGITDSTIIGCSLCPYGTYNDLLGQASCKSFNLTTHMGHTYQFPVGKHKGIGASSVIEIPRGFYYDESVKSVLPCNKLRIGVSDPYPHCIDRPDEDQDQYWYTPRISVQVGFKQMFGYLYDQETTQWTSSYMTHVIQEWGSAIEWIKWLLNKPYEVCNELYGADTCNDQMSKPVPDAAYDSYFNIYDLNGNGSFFLHQLGYVKDPPITSIIGGFTKFIPIAPGWMSCKHTNDPIEPIPAGVITNSPYNCTTIACPPGSYCPGGLPSLYCPTNTWSGFSAEKLSDCKPDLCPTGYFCDRGTKTLIKCSPGEYFNYEQGRCDPCPEGHICFNSLMHKCVHDIDSNSCWLNNNTIISSNVEGADLESLPLHEIYPLPDDLEDVFYSQFTPSTIAHQNAILTHGLV